MFRAGRHIGHLCVTQERQAKKNPAAELIWALCSGLLELVGALPLALTRRPFRHRKGGPNLRGTRRLFVPGFFSVFSAG